MAVPEYQTFMAPVLRALQDGQPRSAQQIRELVAAEMDITEEDRQEGLLQLRLTAVGTDHAATAA